MSRAILFDFNGVIVDDEPQHCAALIATLAEYGYPLDQAGYYRDYLGFDDRECFRFAFGKYGHPTTASAVADAIERKAVRYEEAIRDSMTLIPGAAEFIRAAADQGLRLAIVSGALRREIELVLTTAGLRQQFEVIVPAEAVTACKPDPAGYRRAVAELAMTPRDCVVIEDSLPGLGAARAAALRCAMIATSHPANDLADADLVWQDLSGHHPDELPWAR